LRTDRSYDDDYYSRFNCKIPFLNGGLFDPINNYDWVHTDISFPNELFSNTNPTKEGDIGDGILDIFDRYNFTVCEDEPLEKEVAIDPELLGKTYEKFNAIRPDNFDEYLKSIGTKDENKFNKAYGVYYTRPEIVHFMCRQSLTEYLWNQTTKAKLDQIISKKDIGDLIELGELITEYEATALIKKENLENGKQKSTDYTMLLSEGIRQQAETIDGWLADIAVCDPAVGSGAFPVGMMSEIVRARHTLSLYIKNGDRTSYTLKRSCIENSLYGVDIDAGACEIAKLRLWLSMVVEEDDIKSIKPLPNLDYKIVCGDSLMKVEKELFNNELFHELEELKPIYFGETNYTKKQDYKRQMDELISQITSGNTQFDFEVYFSEVFHRKKGFDVVIGNPPYIQLQKTFDDKRKYADRYKQLNYETFERTGDIYCLFYEKGVTLLNNGGHLAFITSNKWMRATYGKQLRNYFLKNNPKILIDLGPGVFEKATVDTNILIIQKEENQHLLQAVTITENKKNHIDLAAILKRNGIVLNRLTQDAWFIGDDAEQRLKEKIERIGKPLKDWDVNIYRGILTGLNEAFIIDSDKRQEILDNCLDEDERRRTEAIIKPILRGRDIKRYYYEWAGLWVIVIPAGWTNENKNKENAENFISNQFPALMNHLKQFETKAKKRDDQGDYWWELRACAYYPEFEKEKVIYSEIVREPQFHYDNEKFYVEATSFLMTGEHIKYICGLLNSKSLSFFFKKYYAGGGLGKEGYRYKKAFLENLPIPPITPSNESTVRQIELLVDKILAEKRKIPRAIRLHGNAKSTASCTNYMS
jgi:Eco57I restriction endonuclease.